MVGVILEAISGCVVMGCAVGILVYFSSKLRTEDRSVVINDTATAAFIVPLVLLLFGFATQETTLLSLRHVILSDSNIKRMPRVIITATSYMLLVWRRNPLNALKNGLIFALFSFIAAPVLEIVFYYLAI